MCRQFQLTAYSCCLYLVVLSESESGAGAGDEGTSLGDVGGSIVHANDGVDEVTDALIEEFSLCFAS